MFGAPKGSTFSAIQSIGGGDHNNEPKSSPRTSPRSILKKPQIASLNPPSKTNAQKATFTQAQEKILNEKMAKMENESLNDCTSLSADLLGMVSALDSGDNNVDPKDRLDQLEALESQLTGIKDMISQAKDKASEDLEAQRVNLNNLKLNSQAVATLDLTNNLNFMNLSHQVDNIRVLHNTQYDRLKDVVSILNNHADRITTIEDSISDIRDDMKRTSLNSMSERLLENMLVTHQSRPHFILELFDIVSNINSDDKRKMAIQTLTTLKEYNPNGYVKKSDEEKAEVPKLKELAEKKISEQEQEKLPESSEIEVNKDEEPDMLSNLLVQTTAMTTTDDSTSSDTATDTENEGGTTSNAEFSDMHTIETQDLKRIDDEKNDMVTKLLSAAQLGANITQLQDEVRNIVTELLPQLTKDYQGKVLSDEVIDQAKTEIVEYILEYSTAFKNNDGTVADETKVYLYNTIEKCLRVYKNKSVTEESTNILMDIATAILKAMLHAKSQGTR